MRKRLYAIFLALTAAIGISGGTVFGAAKTTQVDTITLETQTADDEVAVDLGWKTQQDKGRWIDKMGIADDVNSLVLIINNIEDDTDTVKTNTGNGSSDKVVKVKRKQLPGNSRMLYLSRTENRGLAGEFLCQLLYFRRTGRRFRYLRRLPPGEHLWKRK